TVAKQLVEVLTMESRRRRLAGLPSLAGDTVLSLLAALFSTVHFLVIDRGGDWSRPWGVTLAVLCALSLLLRSRWPVGTLLTVGVLGTLYLALGNRLLGIMPTVLIAFYSVAAYSTLSRPRVWAVAAAVALALNAVSAGVALTSDGPPGERGDALLAPGVAHGADITGLATGVLLDSGWMLIALLLGEALRGRHALAREAELRAVQAERAQQETAQRRVAEERLRIARELHDVLAHTVALINVQAGVAAHVLDQQPEQAREALIHIKDASRATLQELRALVGVLREGETPAPLAPTPGLDALDDLIGTVRDAGLTVEVEDTRTNGPLPATVDVAAYRILQESLTNAIKYAGTASVRVAVRQDATGLDLDVTNKSGDGAVTAAAEGSGHGIHGMRERATALGGSLEAGPMPDGGFRVHARLPVSRGSE
ncbi:MAG: sensor histidine kinase, partial [Dehalococcoidia bacterium]